MTVEFSSAEPEIPGQHHILRVIASLVWKGKRQEEICRKNEETGPHDLEHNVTNRQT
jgi:hypothetical protein